LCIERDIDNKVPFKHTDILLLYLLSGKSLVNTRKLAARRSMRRSTQILSFSNVFAEQDITTLRLRERAKWLMS